MGGKQPNEIKSIKYADTANSNHLFLSKNPRSLLREHTNCKTQQAARQRGLWLTFVPAESEVEFYDLER